MKTLYIHIGTPKTATSSIQAFCSDNRGILEKNNCCYPKMPMVYPHRITKRNGLFLHAPFYDEKGRRQPEEEARRFQQGFDYVKELFGKFDSVILSDETIWHAMFSRKKTLWQDIKAKADADGYTVKAIVYLRRQDAYVDSWWNQLIKMRASHPATGYEETPWEDFCAAVPGYMQLHYEEALEKVANGIGKENVIVRRFERGCFEGGMIQTDFLKCIGLEMTDEYQIINENVNLRLAGNTHEFKRILNGIPMTDDENHFFCDALLKCSPLSDEAYKSNMFSVEELQEFMAEYREGNRRIAEEYLGEENKDLFSMNFKDLPKWEKQNPYIYDDMIRFIGACNIEMMKELKKTQKEMNDLKYKLRHPLRTLFSVLKKKLGMK